MIKGLIRCDNCNSILDHWDASGHKCCVCDSTFSIKKGEKILSRLTELKYLEKTIVHEGKTESTEYRVLNNVVNLTGYQNK